MKTKTQGKTQPETPLKKQQTNHKTTQKEEHQDHFPSHHLNCSAFLPLQTKISLWRKSETNI